MKPPAAWDKSVLPLPRFYVGNKEVSETDYRKHLHKEGRSDKEIELLLAMIRDIWLGDD